MPQTVAIITVNYNNYPAIEEFLSYFSNQTNTNFHLFISDLSDKKQNIATTTSVDVIKADNKGYSYGINLALKKAKDMGYTLFAIMNNDVRVDKTFVNSIIDSLQSNPHSLIGAKIYYEKGYEYHKSRYTSSELGNVIWYAGGQNNWDHGIPKHIGVDEVDHGQFNKKTNTEFITGCFIAFDRVVLEKIGLWDESYFLYYEDADYSERAKKRGVTLLFDPSIMLWHKVSQAVGGTGSILQQKYQNRNRFRYGMKYAPLKTKLHLIKNKLFA